MANLDTGVDGTHPALASRWRGANGAHPWQECWLDLYNGDTEFPEAALVNEGAHGTHVMGTMTGLGATTGDSIGVAWGAQWIASNAIASSDGDQANNVIITAFQWFADPDGNPETIDDVPDVVQNSWGVSPQEPGYEPCDSLWWGAIDNCEAAGVVVTFSAGNSGPVNGSIIVPADRATSATNTFSIGAIDASHGSFPFPLAGFSSRGPSRCAGAPENVIKPEVVAPGVDVYSCVPGGAYQGNWSGTSMAGPHAAGIVALIRQANPDLDVESIKQILLDTARPEGSGEDNNDYGHGLVDAFAAVEKALGSYGQISGTVVDASWNDAPLAGAEVVLLDTRYRFQADANGAYHGAAPAVAYRAVASLFGIRPDTAEVEIPAGQHASLDFSLLDDLGPALAPLAIPGASTDTLGPYPVRVGARDPSTVASVQLIYRTGEGSWTALPMAADSGRFTAALPGGGVGTEMEYYIRAVDGPGNVSTLPAASPDSAFALLVLRDVYHTSFEDPDPGWQVGEPGDRATSGIWVRARPVATYDPQDHHIVQPGSDHDGGGYCYVTGSAPADTTVGANDVDGGCTTLRSGLFRLAGQQDAYVSYARWFGEGPPPQDDTLHIDVSSDAGAHWTALERVAQPDTVWHVVTLHLNDFVSLTDSVCFRVQACDLGTRSIVEAALDDFSVSAYTPNTFGQITGRVTNASWKDAPLTGGEVTLLGSPYHFPVDAWGHYLGAAPAASYRVVANLFGVRPDTAEVQIPPRDRVQLDFSLKDERGPALTPVVIPGTSVDTLGSYPVQVIARDPSDVASVQLVYRKKGGSWTSLPMSADSGRYNGGLPGSPPGTTMEYYIRAADNPGNVSTLGGASPDSAFSFEVMRNVYRTSFETPETTWQVGETDDQATSGIWVRARPIGAYYLGRLVRPADDHDGGGYCYVTGNAPSDTARGVSNVDDGCTTLRTPLFPLAGQQDAYVSYARWFGEGPQPRDDVLRIDVSSDAGAHWIGLERVEQPDTSWHVANIRINDYVQLTDQVCFRFRACDLGAPSMVEAALDDFGVTSFLPLPAPQSMPDRTRFLGGQPNPGRDGAVLRFDLQQDAPVKISIYNAGGRLVRSLDLGELAARSYRIPWDGRDAAGRQVPSGVYYCRFRAGAVREQRSVVILR